MLPETELFAVAARLARSAGRGQPVALDRISGGRNNRVYRVTLEDDTRVILKNYHADRRDPRDRLATEWAFLNYAWDRQVRAIPQPLACEREVHAALYGWLPGHKLSAGDVAAWHVQAAAQFVCDINRLREDNALAPASEACFTIAMHLDTVDRRVARLASLDPDAPQRNAAERFIRDQLIPAWEAVKVRTIARASAAGIDSAEVIAAEDICISPSDFGFHNALVEGRTIGFIDFEYAGRDDPAKLVCDFFCQPEVAVPLAHYDHFVDRIVAGLRLGEAHRERFALLLDAYRIKWICIVLNEFLPIDAARRSFADPRSRARECESQLVKAATLVAQIKAA